MFNFIFSIHSKAPLRAKRLLAIPLSIFLLFAAVSLAAQGSRQGDSLALVDLYNSTNGANWTNKWNLAQPMTSWYGITLTNGRVTRI
ncbi:MAG: hypothetical protein U5L45_00930, partial [Saprospiraceae bacterium]|nr:hypothetical protein [Saprospiraceae bacterium]